ncbi:MobF family relaxase [Nocardioides panzhihuensis]|uniref:MobF family relaxase n=1 Tax=Nocardioides panzhihuensis TaxID=860243 RepID=UPI0015CBA095
MKFYSSAAGAARSYLEKDHSRADDYYLTDGACLAERFAGTSSGVVARGPMDGNTYERWVAGYDVDTGLAKGRLLKDGGKRPPVRFVEVIVNGPKTWSLAAALHPEIGAAYDHAQDRAAREIIGWVAQHSTTRVGPRDRQVQVPVEEIEAAVIRHYTSRAGDPHRHLHLQINARVYAQGRWRGLHTVGTRDAIAAINGIGHAAVMADLEFRRVLAAHGYTMDLVSGEITELREYVGEFSARAEQIRSNMDRYAARWRREHPGEEPGPRLRQVWDRRAWADARPDKVPPTDGAEIARHWIEELHALGHRAPEGPARLPVTAIGRLDRDLAAGLILDRLGMKASAWNSADIRGGAEQLIAETGIVTESAIHREVAEDLTARAIRQCVPLLDRNDVPEHVRALTSQRVLEVEADLNARLALRAEADPVPGLLGKVPDLDRAQRKVVKAMLGEARLLVIEGAAGAGKTKTLATAAAALLRQRTRMIVVTPTKKAAKVAAREVGGAASSAAWLAYQHGFRWDHDGQWGRIRPNQPQDAGPVNRRARLRPGDLLVVDEAGMLDQDLALALLIIADEAGARVAFVGDRHQLPAVGRGGVLDLATRWTDEGTHLTLDVLHRFTDPDYADLTLKLREGRDTEDVFDRLLARGEIIIHPSEAERLQALASLGAADRPPLITADTRDQVTALNAEVRHHRATTHTAPEATVMRSVVTDAGDRIGVGDRITTRRNDPDLDVVNRDTWTVTQVSIDGGLRVKGTPGRRRLPSSYVAEHVELAYASTIHGAQGETVDEAHLLIGERINAAAAYVGMTRGRRRNIAHLVADDLDDARHQWVEIFSRDRADLGPGHAALRAAEDIDRYGPNGAPRYIGIRREPRQERRRVSVHSLPDPLIARTAPSSEPDRGLGL